MPIGIRLTVGGLILVLFRRWVGSSAALMRGGLNKEAVTFLYLEFGVLILIGGGILFLSTFYKLLRNGQILFLYVGGGSFRFDRHEVNKWITDREGKTAT